MSVFQVKTPLQQSTYPSYLKYVTLAQVIAKNRSAVPVELAESSMMYLLTQIIETPFEEALDRFIKSSMDDLTAEDLAVGIFFKTLSMHSSPTPNTLEDMLAFIKPVIAMMAASYDISQNQILDDLKASMNEFNGIRAELGNFIETALQRPDSEVLH